ncbi:MAG: XylR family transcriptional regulator [Candidatus Dactylopiibacterium carminicum]|nr:MAG: XylR family transcriptional regulator [Candidatus Dactylopiibacterium carminicum]
MTQSFRVVLLLKAKGRYGRSIIEGVCDYVKSTRCGWEVLLEEDFRSHVECISDWDGDGVIADFDDPELLDLLVGGHLPVVGVGGSYQSNAAYLKGIPYVASDNPALVRMAYEHLIDMGLSHFAFYSIVPTSHNRWAGEREKAFSCLVTADRHEVLVYRGIPTFAPDWTTIPENLADWIKTLPKPVGIIAVTDSRARQVMQACASLGLSVPEEVAVIGIDDDPLMSLLNRIPLSSVAQGTHEMGRIAAQMLHRRLTSTLPVAPHQTVLPEGVNAQASSLHKPLHDPYVMRAKHFIRQFAAQGIRAPQVADYVGVTRTTLDAHFLRELGHTVHEEIFSFKLRQSQILLKAGMLSYSKVAQCSGFTSLQYMYAVYKREFGCTPVEYQMRHQGNSL